MIICCNCKDANMQYDDAARLFNRYHLLQIFSFYIAHAKEMIGRVNAEKFDL